MPLCLLACYATIWSVTLGACLMSLVKAMCMPDLKYWRHLQSSLMIIIMQVTDVKYNEPNL